MGALAGLGTDYRAQVRVELLAGRLTVDLPAGAVAAPMPPPSLMGAPEPPEVESRAVVDAAGERLVISAVELFQHCADGFRNAARGVVGRWERLGGPAVTALPVPGRAAGVESVAALRVRLEAAGTVVPVAEAFVRHRDTTVQRLSFSVSPPQACGGAAEAEGCRLLTREVLRRLAPGPRRLEWGSGERELAGPGMGGAGGLRVIVPAGWVSAVQRGPDFLVHRLFRLMPFDGPFASFSVYVGGHPQPPREPAVAEPVVRLFGRAVRWRVTRERQEGLPEIEQREVVVRLPGSDHLMVHVMAVTDAPRIVPELEAMTASLTPA